MLHGIQRPRKSKLNPMANIGVDGISNYMNDQFEAKYPKVNDKKSGDITPMWWGTNHVSITLDSCNKWGFPFADIASNAADDPDSWPIWYPPPPFPQYSKGYWDNVVHGYNHYFNPFFQWGITIGYGGAPGNADSLGQTAKREYDNGQTFL